MAMVTCRASTLTHRGCCCCGFQQANAEETLSTLRFGARAKTIKNRVKVNRQLSPEQLASKLDALIKVSGDTHAQAQLSWLTPCGW